VQAYIAMLNVEVLLEDVLRNPDDPERQHKLVTQVVSVMHISVAISCLYLYLQQYVGAMVAKLARGTHNFLPSRLFMSLHMEMFLAHTPPTRDIDYSTVQRDDPHIRESYWAETFPAICEWYIQERALTPGEWWFCNFILSF
jgi:hypothetical protein